MKFNQDTAQEAPGTWYTPSKGELLLISSLQALKKNKIPSPQARL